MSSIKHSTRMVRPRVPSGMIVAVVAGVWAAVAFTHLMSIRIARLWLLGLGVYAIVWLVAVATTSAAVVVLWPRRRRLAAGTLAVAVLAAAGVVLTDWRALYVDGYYRLHRADFAAVAALADRGELTSDEYYGEALPPRLRYLSVDGRAAWIGSFDGGRAVLFLPALTGIPDGAAGYAYHAGPGHYDCFGDPCEAQRSLDAGWRWLS